MMKSQDKVSGCFTRIFGWLLPVVGTFLFVWFIVFNGLNAGVVALTLLCLWVGWVFRRKTRRQEYKLGLDEWNRFERHN